MKQSSLLLVAVLVLNSLGFSQMKDTQVASHSAKIKTDVQKSGIGVKSRVKVTLRNKEKVKGYISKIGDASFEVIDKSTRDTRTVPYADVEKIGAAGLSKGAKIGIGVGAALVVVVVVIAIAAKRAGY